MEDRNIWKNRIADSRAAPMQYGQAILYGAGFSVAILFIGFLNKGGDLNFEDLPVVGLFGLFLMGFLVSFVSDLLFSYAGHVFSPNIVQEGHVAVIKFQGAYTGEVANSGPILIPNKGYSYDLIDCRQMAAETGAFAVRSQDAFQLSAQATIWWSVVDPLQYKKQLEVGQLLDKLTKSSVSSAVASMSALEVVGRRSDINSIALDEIGEVAASYGTEIDRVSVDILEIPNELTELVQLLATLEKRYPDRTTTELADLLMTHSGKIQTVRSETKNTTAIDSPGLEAVLNAAARRFG